MAYTTINKPTNYFEAKTYDGSGASRTLAYDFEVDFFWCKMRNDAYPHNLFDVVRGNLGLLRANQTNAEVGAANTVSFGNASGVTIGSDSSSYGVNQALNDSSVQATYVGFGWKADNTSGSSNTDGSITSTVSANTTSGFSIVSWTGNGTHPSTVGHGLGAVPKMIITKRRSEIGNWEIYNSNLGNNKSILLDTSGASYTDNTWNSTTPTSSVFTVNNNNVNRSGTTIIAYCFAEKKGYSKFGSYTGNGNSNGTFVYTGFKPAFVIYKRTDSGADWHQYDNKRETYNQMNQTIFPSGSYVEQSGDALDFLSNGFKQRNTGAEANASGGAYIYMAFAENPFVSSTGTPVTAR